MLSSKIAAVRRKQSLMAAGRGLAALIGATVLLLLAGMLLDWYFELPRFVRIVLLAIDLTVLTYVVLWYVAAPVLFGMDDDAIALWVEREKPGFRTRLIASVQLSRPDAVPAGASRGMVLAMIAQTEAMAEPMDFTAVVKRGALLKTATLSLLIVLFGGALFAYGSDVSSDLLARVFLSERPVPRKTRLDCVTKDRLIAIGDNVTLEVLARGVIPTTGTVQMNYESGRAQQFSISPAADDATHFTRLIENVQESFKYRIRLNDGHTEWFEVKALPRPAIVAVDFVQTFPAYAHRSPERRSPGDLALLVGSKLTVKVKSSKPVKEGAVRLVGLDQDVKMAVNPRDPMAASADLDVPSKGLSGLSIRLTDEFGLQSKGETVYPVELVPDREPTVRITWPDRKEELATQQAKILVAFDASDDFGIAKVYLRYTVDAGAEGGEKANELDLGPGPEPRTLRRRHEFNLGAIRPLIAEGSVVDYWIEVRDGNNVTGPGKGVSEHYKVKIVSELEKRADLMNRLNDQLGTIDIVTQDQEKLNQNLGAMILEKK
jgi:hypothetical protein